jgi:signal transduction histidine kinase
MQGPYITVENMKYATDLAINEALDDLKRESADMYAQVLDQLGLER